MGGKFCQNRSLPVLIIRNVRLNKFSKNSNLDYLDISLLDIPSRTYLKMKNISITRKLVKEVITSFDLAKALGPDYI